MCIHVYLSQKKNVITAKSIQIPCFQRIMFAGLLFQITRFKIANPVLHLCPCSAVPWNYLLQLRCGEASLHPFVHAKLREMGEAQDHENEEHGPQPDEIPHVA